MAEFLGWLVAFAFQFAILYFYFIIPLQRLRRARLWLETPCVILSSTVGAHRVESGIYTSFVAYRCELARRSCVSSRYIFSAGASSGCRGKKTVVDCPAPGAETVCYVNPADPGDSVIERGMPWGIMIVGIVTLILFAAIVFLVWQDVARPSA